MNNSEEEFQIVEAVLNGQKDRYRELVDRHAPLVFNIVTRFVSQRDEAEELAQEIFVKTYERLSSFKKQSKFSSWLYRIAYNHCRDYAKNIRRKNESFDEVGEQALKKHGETYSMPDAELEKAEWIALLKQGLKEINTDYAEAFLMKYDAGMTYQAMAQRLDASKGALKVRVYRAKKELKAFIEQNS